MDDWERIERMDEWERHRREETNREKSPYMPTAIGIGLLVAAVLIIITANTAAAGFPFVIAASVLLGKGGHEFQKQRRALPPSVNKERELLSAIRDNGGSITPAEAAMETSLTVKEADGMLSELAGGGHLTVESHEGLLFYALPGRRAPELGSRTAE